jgi:hypothetical protein
VTPHEERSQCARGRRPLIVTRNDLSLPSG